MSVLKKRRGVQYRIIKLKRNVNINNILSFIGQICGESIFVGFMVPSFHEFYTYLIWGYMMLQPDIKKQILNFIQTLKIGIHEFWVGSIATFR